jgi:hypothetical protein
MSSKAREALEEVELVLSTWIDHLPPVVQDEARKAIDKAEAALAEPLRNCDVGTAEEQEERYIKLKREHVDRLLRCPAEGHSFFPDSLYWAQMPYEKEGEQ